MNKQMNNMNRKEVRAKMNEVVLRNKDMKEEKKMTEKVNISKIKKMLTK